MSHLEKRKLVAMNAAILAGAGLDSIVLPSLTDPKQNPKHLKTGCKKPLVFSLGKLIQKVEGTREVASH